MKNKILSIAILVLSMPYIYGQINIDLTDDLEIESNSWIVFNPGSYTLPDVGEDGLVQIQGKENIILDGTNVFVDGEDYSGYAIKISNSSNIEIKNFGGVRHYYYAVYITNSDHIIIENNNFSYNKVDSAGWISIWTNYTHALGGGVMMYMTEYGQVNNNSMKYQNDGVALYHCDSITVTNNDFAWNTSYGIRMYFTDQCNVQNNVANHINRPYTNPSDCAAILLIVSNNNHVVNNDFSFSGDGIFLGQYQYSQIANNNYFAYNECSYSPHNAIEATFADGNIFEYNNCNYSHYGLWLGYSFNSVVRGNEIIGNQYAGVAVDRGYNNQIIENEIVSNPTGIELWEGDGISPYQNQNSGDYFIHDNLIEGNTVAISLRETEHTVIEENNFLNNRNGIYIYGHAENDTLASNVFSHTAFYHVENASVWDIQAINNDFLVNDEAMIACNIYDQEDDPGIGEVIWQPYVQGLDPVFMTEIPEDMAEPDMVWYAYPEACWGYGLSEPTTVVWDMEEKVMGSASVHVSTGNGWDVGIMFRPDQERYASWDLDESDTLTFYLKSVNNTGYGFQFCSVILGNDCGGYYKYTASAVTVLNPTMGQWQEIQIPLLGVYPWSRTAFGNISFDEISYLEIHADTWEYGFELWIDAVTFKGDLISATKSLDMESRPVRIHSVQPNPAHQYVTVSFCIDQKDQVYFEVFDLTGKKVSSHKPLVLFPGIHQARVETGNLKNGVYAIRMISLSGIDTKKIIVNHD
jgi:parallel beta-helix repeat protein